jgi:hypothetical protein
MPRALRTAFLAAALAALAALAPLAAGAGEAGRSLPADLDQYRHVNTLVVPGADSPIHGIHHFYMNETARQAFRQRPGKGGYPAGSRIVGKVYKVVETDDGRLREGGLAAYTYMAKEPDYVSAEKTGGWLFVMFDAQGRAKDLNPAQKCFGCHAPSPETDYVLSEPLE